jgi:NAD(P)-dependent dehydrogenase (short-subunit alcohol dehydrogenase family)
MRTLVRGDLADPAHCRAVIDRSAAEFGGIDVLVSNAAFQMTHSDLGEISDEEWDYTFRLNVGRTCASPRPHAARGFGGG